MVGGGWRLAVGGGWRLAVGGGWRLAVGGGWRSAVGGGWRRLAVGGSWGRSLKAVLRKKKTGFLRAALPTTSTHPPTQKASSPHRRRASDHLQMTAPHPTPSRGNHCPLRGQGRVTQHPNHRPPTPQADGLEVCCCWEGTATPFPHGGGGVPAGGGGLPLAQGGDHPFLIQNPLHPAAPGNGFPWKPLNPYVRAYGGGGGAHHPKPMSYLPTNAA